MTMRLAFEKKCYEFLNDQQVIKTFVIEVIRNVTFPTAESPLELPRDNSSATLQEKGTVLFNATPGLFTDSPPATDQTRFYLVQKNRDQTPQ